ncbi:hypothetical protein PH210_05900 [Paenibacillus sp. BSR1-1]|uniref:hypothetical protein n=1 Tax=Paenibacillus sp. BSR1-1 TaxID=3020845 RepID=UPI0025AF9C3B|nr:hypothetical protein [Paenibacillus sp. BSR1-1]MDN3015740.1 hypothetical protein [Paenibacillus sp. BSR1-1]
MGNIAVQSFFQNQEVDVKSLRGTIQQVRGIPTLVAYHPLAVRRRPNLWSYFAKDWHDLAKLYNQTKDPI